MNVSDIILFRIEKIMLQYKIISWIISIIIMIL